NLTTLSGVALGVWKTRPRGGSQPVIPPFLQGFWKKRCVLRKTQRHGCGSAMRLFNVWRAIQRLSSYKAAASSQRTNHSFLKSHHRTTGKEGCRDRRQLWRRVACSLVRPPTRNSCMSWEEKCSLRTQWTCSYLSSSGRG